MIQIKHFCDYLYSGDKEIPCAEYGANEWLKKHPEYKIVDIKAQFVEYPDEVSPEHEHDKMFITIVYETENSKE